MLTFLKQIKKYSMIVIQFYLHFLIQGFIVVETLYKFLVFDLPGV